ncbi:hypothetical protein VOLCADRAFT_107343 [Volvox carteri f. nagariensis]|uniref:Protein farnesyltransferase/geranylgeranyltransferase type-1 subunit alpha n=1 Tax=Volvox carteri f. nagariensis TaxID=3068 RepID=D8UDE5_VOLCA|nr:uncharacterized protein VOLCADRAFT_107343 [Volvox carteri f. nagariensis]EFJ42298.1 hypothetical protein VOLCADRAFT_107343 [Volvox carteri f. nagariensis]|eukprot:XP_002956696.1 hypothetical protein VOLCADRAFT_107343 [Volvox carteri f. nagariensis]
MASQVPYSQRPEWSDVTPMRLPEPERVVAIQYLPEHAEALGYFRAVLQSGELSERVLALTADMIRFNQADYTAWRVRWLCVQKLGTKALEADLDFTHSVMLENAKNYQLWNHRRLCALQLGPNVADCENEFTREAINFDEKNYHAWAHRQAIVKMTGRWQAELEFASELIQRDVRNNTAWNQRMFVLKHMPRSEDDSTMWLRSELSYVADAIQRAPRNEAPWRYLTGLFVTLEPWASQPRALSCHPEVYTICTEALLDCPSCAPAYDVLAQYYEGVAALGTARGTAQADAQAPDARDDLSATVGGVLQAYEVAQAALDEAAVADPMRILYWYHRQRGVAHLMAVTTGMPT